MGRAEVGISVGETSWWNAVAFKQELLSGRLVIILGKLWGVTA